MTRKRNNWFYILLKLVVIFPLQLSDKIIFLREFELCYSMSVALHSDVAISFQTDKILETLIAS